MTQSQIIDIFRHGESEGNAGLRTDVPATIPLTELGRTQSLALSERFDELSPPGLIVTSPYIRTDQTAAPTIARFPEVPREVWPIHEFTFLEVPKYAGTTQNERKEAARGYWTRNDPDYVDGPGAESFNQMIGRVDGMLGKFRRLSCKYAAVFCHGLIMQAMFVRLTERQVQGRELMQRVKSFRRANPVENTGRLRLGVSNGTIEILSRW